MAIVRYNINTFDKGEEYFGRLSAEAERSFHILMSLLSSYWQATVDGPNYAHEIKAIAIELSRLRLALEDIQQDTNFSLTRTEFVYQIMTSMLFPATSGAPDIEQTDVDFRQFLFNLVKIYFGGSIPASVEAAVKLVVGDQVVVRENFIEARNPGSGYDISDQFGFSVDIILNSPSQINAFLADRNIRILLATVRPSHTLYRIRHILHDKYVGTLPRPANPPSNLQSPIGDSFRFRLSNYGYEDLRKFVGGVTGVDALGSKSVVFVQGEDHSSDFGGSIN